MSSGFVSPTEISEEVNAQLSALTAQTYILPTITRGRYISDEEDLPDELKQLLHGRAFVIDEDVITAITPNDAVTYYIAGDQVQGLIVPARSLSIDCQIYDIHYRWSDNGEQWTNWITLPAGMTDSTAPIEKNRYAEIQVYADTYGAVVSLRATR